MFTQWLRDCAADAMGKHEKLVAKILEGRADSSIKFRDLRRLMLRMGFVERVRGSHHLFRHVETGVRINLQSARGMVKPYQVRQVRLAIIELQRRKSD
jgi:predicted RNA binding protein YcfA (HicA-like mRNA interferase family)